MVKKFSLLLAAAAVLAFAVPAFANAATGLKETESAGVFKNVAVGSLITGTNTTAATFSTTKLGTITCKAGNVMVEAKLTVNSSTEVKASDSEAKFPASCENSAGDPVELEYVTLTELVTNGGGTGTGKIDFALKFPSGLTCTVSSPASGNTGTYNPNETGTGKGGDLIKLTNQTLNVTPATCGSTGTLNATFTIETQNKTPVYLL